MCQDVFIVWSAAPGVHTYVITCLLLHLGLMQLASTCILGMAGSQCMAGKTTYGSSNAIQVPLKAMVTTTVTCTHRQLKGVGQQAVFFV